jgi:CHAT domain-containing protein
MRYSFRTFIMRLLVIALLLPSQMVAAQYYDSLLQVAFRLSAEHKYAASQQLVEQVRAATPEVLDVYILSSHNLLNQNKADEAAGYITIGLQVDPTSYAMYMNCAYYFAAKGNVPAAHSYLAESLNVFPAQYTMHQALTDMRSTGANLQQVSVFNELANWYEQQQKISGHTNPTLDKMLADYLAAMENGAAALLEKANLYADQYSAMGWHEMALAAYAQAALWLRSYGYQSQALEVAQVGYTYYYKNGYRDNAFMASFLLYQLIEAYQAVGNYERVVQHVEELTTVATKTKLHVYDILGLITASAAYDGLNKPEEAKTLAGLSVQFAQKYGFGYALVHGYAALFSNAFKLPGISSTELVRIGESAQQMAFSFHFDALAYAMFNNLAIAYLRLGTYEGQAKCFSTLGGLTKHYKANKQYSNAALTLNNLGSIWYNSGQDFNETAAIFEESIQLAEQDMGHLSYEDKLNFYQSQISAYDFLTASYAHLKKPAQAFESMEGSRSRVLTERLAKGKKVRKASLQELQNMLGEDEACIMYSLFSGHEVSILVVTKKSSQVLFHSDNSFIGDIMDKYRQQVTQEHDERKGDEPETAYDPDRRVQASDFNKVTQLTRKFFERPGMADNILQEYLKGYYKFLLLPIANRLTGIKKLILSPDGVLNFIPFEALTSYDGKYLVEKYDIRYMQSVGALMQLEQRNYPSTRKNLLAMGGAVFEEMNVQGGTITNQKDKNQLQLEVADNVKRNRSQRKIYATIFGNRALTPLPGTATEVKTIASVVPHSETYLAERMTENQLKALSTNGQLAGYKILHLATHGFVVNDIPELSGVAMSIYRNEQQGEDGFLTVHEISSLNLQTDLTVLSACQTALGKIYSGEGVTGLTQSLMLAGSNAALVSLWPVNDNSTMQFMSSFYKEWVTGKKHVPIINDLKRKFIKGQFGEQYKHPNYWAPFVYYGRP